MKLTNFDFHVLASLLPGGPPAVCVTCILARAVLQRLFPAPWHRRMAHDIKMHSHCRIFKSLVSNMFWKRAHLTNLIRGLLDDVDRGCTLKATWANLGAPVRT
jgi:hypothetical protein